jgi:single-strand DNA-binding protein
MARLNKVFLMGNLTRDPELRYSSGAGGGGAIGGAGAPGGGQGGGSAICKFGLAVNRQWRDQGGQMHEEVTFVDITVFGRQAETCNEFLKKGRAAFIEGRLNFSTWEDRESGQKRSKLDVVAENVQFLGGPRDGEGGGGGGGGYRGSREAAPAAAGASGGGAAAPAPRSGAPGASGGRPAPQGEGVDFDDIPF